jgi:hypothetical protein
MPSTNLTNAYNSPAMYIGSTKCVSMTRAPYVRQTPLMCDNQLAMENISLSIASWKVNPTMCLAQTLTILSNQLNWPKAAEVTVGKDPYGQSITKVMWKDFGIMCSKRATLSLAIARAIGFRLRTPKPAPCVRERSPTQTLAGLLKDSCNIQSKPLRGNLVTSHPRRLLRERMLGRAKENQ